jgi:hypothetical protein
MTTLICPECQRENESERIFCHGCGARLDRSGLTQQNVEPEETEQTRQRVQRLFDPRRGRLRRTLLKFSKLILGAFLTAGVVQIILPVDLPPAPKPTGLPAQINFELESTILYHRQARYTEDQVNGYLAYALKGKQRSLDKLFLTFKRALVSFGEGTCTIIMERSLFSYSLYQSATYKVNVADGKIVTSSQAGSIGRLPIHPAAMKYAGTIFDDLWSALARERKLVGQMGTIELHRGNVALSAAQ